jgi:hypothetical protein
MQIAERLDAKATLKSSNADLNLIYARASRATPLTACADFASTATNCAFKWAMSLRMLSNSSCMAHNS